MTALHSNSPRAWAYDVLPSIPGVNKISRHTATADRPGGLLATARSELAQAFHRMARALGFSLILAPDGLHALMAAVQWAPTLLVVDSGLPGLPVEQLEAKLGRDARTACIPRIHVTAPAVANRAPDLPLEPAS